MINNQSLTQTAKATQSFLTPALALWLAAAVPGMGQGCDPADLFGPPNLFAAGPVLQAVAAADLDGDGNQDLAVASANNVSVLLGNGDGTFQPERRFAVGLEPRSVAIADLNGDGIPDVVAANADSGDVSVLLGNGDGTLQGEMRFAAGRSLSVAIGDLNGDGTPDLVTANFLADDVSVLLGNGDGTFQIQQRFPAGAEPRTVAIGDLQGDGALDLVVGDRLGGNTVAVLLGNGDGTFQPLQSVAAGQEPRAVAISDFNGDLVPDLVAANNDNGDISVMLGNGDGSFQPQQRFAAGVAPRRLAIGDLDRDGKLDLAVANFGSSDVSVLLGNGDGTFQPQRRFQLSPGSAPSSVAIADFDRDGAPDLAVATTISVAVLFNRCDAPKITQQPAPVVFVDVGAGPRTFSVEAEGAQPLAFQWRRDGVPLIDGGTISGTTTDTLIVLPTLANEARYDVVVANDIGSATSEPGVLAVRNPCPADLSEDGVMDVIDFFLFVSFFAAGCP